MRKQIAAANWKMNCTYQQAEVLLDDILNSKLNLKKNHQVIFAVPFPYLIMANSEVAEEENYFVAAQNCYRYKAGAYTGEVSAEMLQSIGIHHCIIGHSERREYFKEDNQMLAEKINVCLEYEVTPIFCCGEPLSVREAGVQNDFVQVQLEESLFHLSEIDIQRIIIAYEPIWAIGTGKTATTAEAQDMHAYIRLLLRNKYGSMIADNISILYGGSVKAGNSAELFSSPDVDGGLVGGASLISADFVSIIRSLK